MVWTAGRNISAQHQAQHQHCYQSHGLSFTAAHSKWNVLAQLRADT
jgi:hypothetical protein